MCRRCHGYPFTSYNMVRFLDSSVGVYPSTTNDWSQDYSDGAEDGTTSTALPQTIVLNRKGEVVYNRVGSVAAEMLDRLYEDASQ